MKHIPLTQGQHAIVDDDDYPRLSQWKWHLCRKQSAAYAARTTHPGHSRKVRRYLHHEVLGLTGSPRPLCIDHINGDPLDNRKCNLRYATRAQNAANVPPRKTARSASRYKGVHYEKIHRLWLASVSFNNRHYNLGYFKSEYDAMVAYNLAAVRLAGDFAYVNHWTGPTNPEIARSCPNPRRLDGSYPPGTQLLFPFMYDDDDTP